MKNEDIIKEIKLIKYQLKLMKMMIDGDRYPYFMFITDYDISEDQEKILRKIMLVLKARLEDEREDCNDLYKEDHELLISVFKEVGLSTDLLFSLKKPTFNEFSTYARALLFKDINIEYLLMSMKMQSICVHLCDYLLNDIQEK